MTHTYGYCQCGCGQKTRIAPVNDKSKGWIKGQPLAFLKGHSLRNQRGETAPRWRGGRRTTTHGYITIWTPDNSRKYEHIHVAEIALGRPLQQISRGHPLNEVVHHINGDKTDNRPNNLLICTHEYHTQLHHRLEASDVWPEFPKVQRNQGKGARA